MRAIPLTKTITILVNVPHGTTSCVVVELWYRNKLRHSVSGPKGCVKWLVDIAKDWACINGFTHVKFLAVRL